MSNRATSVGEMEQADDSKMKKLPPSTKQSLKHTTCLTGTTAIPSAFMSYSLQAAANSNLTDGKHHHHHHHHHHHGHHTSPHVIHRTTSESLRLGGDTSGGGGSPSFNNSTTMSGSSGTSSSSGHQPLMLNTSVARKPKTSSFQITSVTVGNKLSADNGEDSADDLDESHTDDNSRITDIENETPSFSEDTFSKEDVFFSNSALGTAPVIPTSSQYGLVIVDPELGGVGGQSGQNLSNVHVSVSDAGINIVGSPGGKLGDSDQKDMHYRNERFKVVKIESTEPFKRGRWMCMDYLDHSTLQTSENMQANTNNNTSSSNQTGTTTNDSGVVMAENHIDMNCDSSDPNGHYNTGVVAGGINMSNSPGQTLQHTISVVSLEHQHQQQLSNAVGGMPIGIHAQTMAHPSNVAAVNLQQPNIAGQSLPPSQIHQTIAGQHQSQPPPQVQSDYQQTGNHIPGQSQPAHFYINNQHNQSSAPNIHGATLPSNINMHNGVPSNFIPQVQQQSQVPTQPMSTVNMPMSNTAEQNPINTAPPMTSSNLAQTANSGHQPTVISQPTSMPQSTPQSQLCSEQFMPQSVAQSYPASALSVTSLPNNNTASGLSHDVHHVDVNSIQHTSVAGMVSSANVASNVLPQSISPAVDTMLQQSQPAQSPHQGIQTIPPLLQENVQPIVLLSDSASSVSTPQQSQVPSSVNLAPQQSVSNAEDDQPAAVEADSESASGTSAVAIDNKIEQAMDLVKSHLMIAVREEVEVLKEKIAELMDRINQLELENTILKANVSQETLSQLSATIQTASAKPSQNPNTSNGPVS